MSNHTTAAGYFVFRGQKRIKRQPLLADILYWIHRQPVPTIELPFDIVVFVK